MSRRIEILLSDDAQVRERAMSEILKERSNMAEELTKVIRDPKQQVKRPQSVTSAIRMVGELRMEEAIPALVENIGFPWVPHPQSEDHPGPFTSTGVFGKRIEELLPAVPALINIGAPCADAVIAKLLSADSLMEQDAALTVLRELSSRNSIRNKLERARNKAGVKESARIDKALAAIAEQQQLIRRSPATRK